MKSRYEILAIGPNDAWKEHESALVGCHIMESHDHSQITGYSFDPIKHRGAGYYSGDVVIIHSPKDLPREIEDDMLSYDHICFASVKLRKLED